MKVISQRRSIWKTPSLSIERTCPGEPGQALVSKVKTKELLITATNNLQY